jgi:hypothetical protein
MLLNPRQGWHPKSHFAPDFSLMAMQTHQKFSKLKSLLAEVEDLYGAAALLH